MNALFGHSGFVGSNLKHQHNFEALFDRRNVADSVRHFFEVAVCAAAPGSMLEANKAPARDEERINALIEHLSHVRTKRFVLISTIAVLTDFTATEAEDTRAFDAASAYGRNRRQLEVFCESHFQSCLIVRLPALFGEGLRKNFLFDLLNPVPTYLPPGRLAVIADALPTQLKAPFFRLYAPVNEFGLHEVDRPALNNSSIRSALESALIERRLSSLEFTNPESRFQFYNLRDLWANIEAALRHDIRCLHAAPEPLRTSAVFQVAMGSEMPMTQAAVHVEDMRTRYSALFNANAPYSANASETLSEIRDFLLQKRESK